jgi:hypothetical protein
MGLLSAFMCALANGIYANPPEDPVCRGAAAVTQMTIVEWVSMGCFFLVIILTVILAADMDGVPDDLLFRHLHANRWLYTAPQPLAYAGLFLLACGYGIDLDERVGCPVFRFGALAAPCFPLLTFFVLKYAQRARKKSGELRRLRRRRRRLRLLGRSPRDRAARGGTRGTKPRAVRSLLRERRGISYRSIGIVVIPYHIV